MKLGFFLLNLLITTQVFAFTVGAYNIRNFDYDQRSRIRTNKSELANILKSINADVLSVEEINNTKEFGNFVASNLPGYEAELSRCGGAHGQSLGFLYKKETVELLSFHEDLATSNPGRGESCDSGSRPLAIGLFRIRATGQKFYGITVHLKSGSQPDSLAKRAQQYEIIKNLVLELRNSTGVKDFFMGGDFNTTEYRNRGADFTNLNKVVKELGMVNLTANLPCSSYWWGGTNDNIESPSLLDHVIVTPGLVKKKSAKAITHSHCQKVNCQEAPVQDLGKTYQAVSDHCPITATVQ